MNGIEAKRLEIQITLDAAKTQVERNRLGQFATPSRLATEVVGAALSLLRPKTKISFLDPAFGTGAFYSALLSAAPANRLTGATGFEIDPHYGNVARELWSSTPLNLRLEDFTRADPPTNDSDKINFLICNPPYVRHHHMTAEDKRRIQNRAEEITGVRLSGLAGLYCNFLLIADAWMSNDGIAVWLIPSEFMAVNYGREVQRYLLDSVTLNRIHWFDPESSQFDDALVSSAVVFITKNRPATAHSVELTFGSSIDKPTLRRFVSADTLRNNPKWTTFVHSQETSKTNEIRIGDLFAIKRGLATGANDFFIMTEDDAIGHGIDPVFLKPILPSSRHLTDNVIEAGVGGRPLLDKRLVLLDVDLPEIEIRRNHPLLWRYLATAMERGIHEQYLCSHRTYWYAQEKRPPAPIICTYMNRHANGRLFRFIRNRSSATATNVFLLLYPKPSLQRLLTQDTSLMDRIWIELNKVPVTVFIGEGRVYGGGLHKMEPKELANTPVNSLSSLLPPDFLS